MNSCEKQEPVFDLIKAMSKAEKRNFKLYATRLSGNQESKFMTLFDLLDHSDDYNEAKVLAKCPITKQQLPNMKAHLYRQLLVSIRLLDVSNNAVMQIREQLDFARILYDKCLYRQSTKLLDKIEDQALALEQHTLALDIHNFQKQIDMLNMSPALNSDAADKSVDELCAKITSINTLLNISIRLYTLHQTLGYARTQKDLDLIVLYFQPQLRFYEGLKMSFLEKFYYFQAMAWYHYIRHDFANSYRYGRQWVELFDANPSMKTIMYDNYMKGYSRILEGLFMMRHYKRFCEALERFTHECNTLGVLNDNAEFISKQILYTNRLNKCFLEGTFKEGILLVRNIESFLNRYSAHLSVHTKMLLYYKIACTYFGDSNHKKCIEYLSRIAQTKDPQIRRDLQCYAKILNLISSYELGIDHNIEYQIRSVYRFLVKMNDLQAVQYEILHFLKKLNKAYGGDIKNELTLLYEKLKPYENHPYERRTFFYLDIISWLESKISGKSIGEIIRQKFREQNSK